MDMWNASPQDCKRAKGDLNSRLGFYFDEQGQAMHSQRQTIKNLFSYLSLVSKEHAQGRLTAMGHGEAG